MATEMAYTTHGKWWSSVDMNVMDATILMEQYDRSVSTQ